LRKSDISEMDPISENGKNFTFVSFCSGADYLFEYGSNLFEESERVHHSTLYVPVFEAPTLCGSLMVTDR